MYRIHTEHTVETTISIEAYSRRKAQKIADNALHNFIISTFDIDKS